MTEPEEVFRRVLARHELPYPPVVGAKEPEEVFEQMVNPRSRMYSPARGDAGQRALEDPGDPGAVAADREWLVAMMARRVGGGA
ncbi:hypothetical protein [Nonomuraea sp. NPDC005692]|uniref:hypothetical protein n=1 Tax=Nonomuraea sp. NPDC005692 TaxID=3157168 RepID=UPI0033EF67D6